MLRLNLLPHRLDKKKRQTVNEILFAGSTVILLVLAAVAGYLLVASWTKDLHRQMEAGNTELGRLKSHIGELEKLKKMKEDATRRLTALDSLQSQRNGSLTRLVSLSEALNEQVWITKYVESGGSISIAGASATESAIAEFMTKLQAAPEFDHVELLFSEQADGPAGKVKRFELAAKPKSPADVHDGKPDSKAAGKTK